MNPEIDYQKYAILFVDDEAQALKYFKRFYDKKFTIYTAQSADDARKVIEAHPNEIGVVITDQRMPEERGVSLLAWLRRNHPVIVRLLTTAFSDLQEAVAAVNEGAIYEYITKPWHADQLELSLRRALELFVVRRDRDALMREKVYALQHTIVADRARNLAILATALSYRIRNPMLAVKTFLEEAPALPDELEQNPFIAWKDLWKSARIEGERITGIIDNVLARVTRSEDDFCDSLSAAALKTLTDEAFAEGSLEAVGSLPADVSVRCDRELIGRLLKALNRCLQQIGVQDGIKVEIAHGTDGHDMDGIVLRFYGERLPDGDMHQESLYTVMSPESIGEMDDVAYLVAFFITYHHGGRLQILNGSGRYGFEVFLPKEPESTRIEDLDPGWLQRVMTILDE